MKSQKLLVFLSFELFFLLAIPAEAATLFSQSVPLSPGWNIVSTPRILDSHSFSATENSTNFDIYVLDASSTTGWLTMAQEGQTEFTPLYGYFINNKTGANQTLTLNYKSGTTPNQRLFEREFTVTGWYSFGIANPSYALVAGTATTTDTNNPSSILNALVVGSASGYDTVVDFTNASSTINIDATNLSDPWKATINSDVNTLNDFRETKGYALYIKQANSLYIGQQDDTTPQCRDGIDNDGDSNVDYPADIGCGSLNDNDESNVVASLSMSLSSSPSAQSIVAGGQGVTFANIQLDASQSGENVRISSIPLHIDQAFVAAGSAVTNLTVCKITNSAGSVLNGGSNVVNSLTADATTTVATTNTKVFSLDNSLTITKGTVVTLILKCDVGSSATANDSYRFKTYSGDAMTVTGVVSGNSTSTTITSAQAGRQTVAGAGTVTVSTDSSSPSYAIGAGGSTGVTVGVAKFSATNEAVNLSKIGLTLVNGTYGATGAQDLVQVYIYNGSTLIGTATFTGSATTATSTLLTSVNLPKDQDTKLTFKVDLADVGTSQSGNQGDLIKVDVLNFVGSGVSSGNTIMGGAVTGLTAVSGVRLLNTFPTISMVTLSSSAAAGKLIRFSVTANAAGDVGIDRFTFSIATSSGVTISGLGLYAYEDSAFSVPVSGQGSSGLIGTTRTATSTSNVQLGVSSPTAPLEVPAGGTRYFELRGSVGGTVSGSSITTTLLGDASYATLAATSSLSQNFIWSPNATTTSLATHADWTDGASVIGLPSGGLIQTVTQ